MVKKKYSLYEWKKPLGGNWNFDKENQKSISKLLELPKPRKKLKSDELTISAMVDVEGVLSKFNWKFGKL